MCRGSVGLHRAWGAGVGRRSAVFVRLGVEFGVVVGEDDLARGWFLAGLCG